MMRTLLFLLGACVVAPTFAHAQSVARRDVPKGQVTGLEMGVEGNMEVTPGAKVRWFVTVYEIVKGRDLRPAAATKLKALASFQRQEPVAEVTTDARGRASIIFDVPDTLHGPFNLVVEARSPKGVKRSFDVSVQLGPRFHTELFVERYKVLPGSPLRAWGRVMDLATNKPAKDHQVQLDARAGGLLIGREHDLRTNQQGVFQALLRAPEEPAHFLVSARAKQGARVARNISAEQAAPPPLIVYTKPAAAVVKPGTTIAVDVVVRTPDGRPVPRATLTGLSIPEPKTESGKKRSFKPVLTDSQGRARVPWLVRSTAEVAEITGQIHALREGIGVGEGRVQVRAARVPVIVRWAVEGGALVPGLPSRVFVRAFHPDGSPWTDLPVRVESGRLQAAATSTDKDGAATLEASVARIDPSKPSACHGPTVAAATLHFGAHSEDLCLPVDPDATVRVRSAPRIRAGATLDLTLDASNAVSGSPVVVTVLSRRGKGPWSPVAQVVVAPGKQQASLPLPPEVRGALWIRARPLVGAVLQPVRGGTTMVWAEPRHDENLRLSTSDTGRMRLARAGTAAAAQGFAIALPVRRGRQLLAELREARGNWPEAGAGDSRWSGFLSAQTPKDDAVSAVLRSGTKATLAMPADSVALGLLRDPWRSRSRFVRGRLGRLILAVEGHVAASVPGDMDNVAIRGPRGWRFNSEILTVLANDMGIEAVAGLDGSPLAIKDLQTLDPEFVYDNVARRLTRERLLHVLVGLRQFVKTEELDYEWARRGDPSTWMSALLQWDDPEGEIMVDQDQIFDGWGRPFAIRKARGGRARFRFLEPIVGYEVVSAGPDGRFGTGDDVFDPFARVLRSTGLYGEAVGEEALLARLHGVELGRATIAVLSEVFEIDPPVWETTEMRATTHSWDPPERTQAADDNLKAQAILPSPLSSSRFAPLQGADTRIDLPLSSDPRSYSVVAGAYSADGVSVFDAGPLRAGAPLLIDANIPPRLRPNETLEVPLRIIGLGRRQELSVHASGSGPIRVELLGKSRFSLKGGQSHSIDLRVSASGVGRGDIHLVFKTAKGAVIRDYKQTLPVLWDGSLRAQHTGALVEGRRALKFKAPADARPVRSLLVVSAPRDLLRDPGFSRVQQRYPESLAWGFALRGEAMPRALIEDLSRRPLAGRAMTTLLDACAAVAWSATSDEGPLQPRRAQAIAKLSGLAAPAEARERSALLVALASSASMLGNAASTDPVTKLVSELRSDGWHAPRTERSRPTMMARLAAGLLLADPQDVPGQEMFKLARAALVPGPHGGKQLPGEGGRAVDGWIGTLALAIAARQLGDDQAASELVRSVAPRLYLGMQEDVESSFWLLAASAYGVFGVASPSSVAVRVDGKPRDLAFKDGVATLSLPRRGAKVLVESSLPVVARLEARYVRPVKTARKSSLSAEIEGELGHSGETAALEATIKNSSTVAVAHSVVEIVLPSTALLSKPARTSIAAAPGVTRVEAPDALGLVRIHLSSLGSKQETRLPLPIRWIGKGTVTGLSISVYDAAEPWRISSTPSRSMTLTAAPVETWK